jgi:hypothetical protein
MPQRLDNFIENLFRDCVEFCSGPADLVVCVGRHGGGGHRPALAGERFVGLVAEDIAEMGDCVGFTGAAAAAFLICPSHCVCLDGLLESFETDFAEILKREHLSFAEFSDDI